MPATASTRLAGWKASASTGQSSAAPGTTSTGRPSGMLQSQTSPERNPPVASRPESAEKARAVTGPACPSSRAARRPVAASQRPSVASVGSAVSSADRLPAIHLPSGLAAKARNRSASSRPASGVASSVRHRPSAAPAQSVASRRLSGLRATQVRVLQPSFAGSSSRAFAESQMWTTRSRPPDASRRPSGPNARARISPAWGRSTLASRLRAVSQTWTVLAESAQASSPPSAVRARVWTWPAWLLRRMIGSHEATSQTRAVVSQPAE